MKEAYVKAKTEIIEFESEDVITTSNQTPFAPYSLWDEYIRTSDQTSLAPYSLWDEYGEDGNPIE